MNLAFSPGDCRWEAIIFQRFYPDDTLRNSLGTELLDHAEIGIAGLVMGNNSQTALNYNRR